MKLFRDYNFKWWQVALLKVYLLVGGIILGSYFADFFQGMAELLFVVFGLLLIYFAYEMIAKRI